MNDYIYISQKVNLSPNKSQIKILTQKFGQVRFIYNFTVDAFKEEFAKTGKLTTTGKLKKYYLQEKRKYEFLKDVNIDSEGKIFQNFVRTINNFVANRKVDPEYNIRFKRKEIDNAFYLGGIFFKIINKPSCKKSFVYFSGLPSPIKIMDKLRFKKPLSSITIKKENDRFYASIMYKMTKQEFEDSHKYKFSQENTAIGIDLGLEKTITTSCGLIINTPLSFMKSLHKISILSKKLEKKVHSRFEGDHTLPSKNYLRFKKKLAKAYLKVYRQRHDYLNKLVSVLVRNFKAISVEKLNITELQRNRFFSKKNLDLSFYETKLRIKTKLDSLPKRYFFEAPIYFPSSKICAKCGYKNSNLDLGARIFKCPSCGNEIDRDINAASNLFKLMKKNIGWGTSKLTIEQKEKISRDCKHNNLRFYFLGPNDFAIPLMLNPMQQANIIN